LWKRKRRHPYPGVRRPQGRGFAGECTKPPWRTRPAWRLRFWHLQLYRPAALPLAQVDLRKHDPQLGMGHCLPHGDYHHGVAAVAYLKHEIVTAHAEDPAADEGHPGKVQALQHYRSPPRGHAERNVCSV